MAASSYTQRKANPVSGMDSGMAELCLSRLIHALWQLRNKWVASTVLRNGFPTGIGTFSGSEARKANRYIEEK